MNTEAAIYQVPKFAIIGHPNEGKSSVLSTLAEDDSVRVSPFPGETTICQSFPVRIDGREIICFIDTPGFQNPRQTLKWFKEYQGPAEKIVSAFRACHKNTPEFHDDCELLGPVEAGAGVIFVVDGSRPVRQVDLAEMEILRLTGAARMAVINSKEEDSSHLAGWLAEFRKNFNSVRIFNSSKATYRQRIELLESLKSIDQQLEPVLRRVVQVFEEDWALRIDRCASLFIDMLKEVLAYRKTVPCEEGREKRVKEELQEQFQLFVSKKEHETQAVVRHLFKHNIFRLTLPPHSILGEDLFSERTWEFLGLNKTQLIVAGALGGAALGVGVDAATIGTSFGIFSALGGLIGAGAAAWKGKEFLSGTKLLGMQMGGDSLRIGPVNNIQLFYILLDRALLFYSYVTNWAHGRRDYEAAAEKEEKLAAGGKEGFTQSWTRDEQKVCEQFFFALQQKKEAEIEDASASLFKLMVEQFQKISMGEDTKEERSSSHPARHDYLS